MKAEISGLYAVTPDLADTSALLGMVEAAVAGGARLLQYRNKIADATLRLEQARALVALCRRHRVPLIINDHLELALSVDAEGLHLGSEDGSVADARNRLGPAKLLGVSCYRLVEKARDAASLGADYVAFGGFFPSRVKPGAIRAPLSLLGEAKRVQPLPIVAIGGITVENAPELITAGADSVAVISALFDGPDIKATAQRFNALFAKGR
ncbi:MAG TPA: thiamine phosphate synthase [Burkholderiales bacterium]|nr:thiamine phosphate synthase [Burkholderiales bacterium]